MNESHTWKQCNEIKGLYAEIKMLKSQTNRQDNLSVASDLRINCIPFVQNENPNDIFGRICSALGISTPAFKSIYRMQSKNGNSKETNSPDAVILVKHHSPNDKNFILISYRQFRKTYRVYLTADFFK